MAETIKKSDEERVQKIIMAQFKQETSSILVQLEKYHTSTQNQITNIFARFLDNLPKDVLSLPIDECEEQYLRMYVKKSRLLSAGLEHNGVIAGDDEERLERENRVVANKSDENDSTLEDRENETDLMEFETNPIKDKDSCFLTSTVKKQTTTKSVFSNNNQNIQTIDESVIADESVIGEMTVTPKVNVESAALDELILQFKYKNGEKGVIQLSKLNEIKLKNLDANHAFYFTKFINLLKK